VLRRRALTKLAAQRDTDEDLAGALTEVFDELLVAAMKRPETRTAICNIVAAGRRPTTTSHTPVRAAAVKANRRR
jgi:hypothetical protein